MKFFDAIHEGLRRAEAQVDRTQGWRFSPRLIGQTVASWFRLPGDRTGQGDLWTPPVVVGLVLLGALLAATILPVLIPLAIMGAIVAALVLFAQAWGREFFTLMRLEDGFFPGRFDKLLWGLLLILLPPVGIWAFGSFRQTHRAEGKVGGPEVEV